MKDPQVLPPLQLCNQILQNADVVKILGIKIAKDLTWDTHIGDILGRASGLLFMLTRLKRFGLRVEDLITIYIGSVCPPFLNTRCPFGIQAYKQITPGFGAYSEKGVQNHLGW